MSRGSIKKDELDRLFHFRDNINPEELPLYPVYDPDYDGEEYRDWGDESDWYIWAVQDDELTRLRGWPSENIYFGTEATSWRDVHSKFFEFYIQCAMFRDTSTLVNMLLSDLRHLSSSMAQIGLFDYLIQEGNSNSTHFIKTEIEYILTTCRSMYETLQKVIRNTWDRVELQDGGGTNTLSKKFSSMALHGDDPVEVDQLTEDYGIPEEFAEYYVDAAEPFAKIRDARDSIVHHGKTVGPIFRSSSGLGVSTDDPVLHYFENEWDSEHISENKVAPLWPVLAYIIRESIRAMNKFVDSITDLVKFPEQMAPEHIVFIRGESIEYLANLNYLMETDPWGVYLREDARQLYIDDERQLVDQSPV
ncbi:hypothetical protein [Halorubrum vacuolatum]|uniref:Uncharacterized protein n=1 Tax=Halorubrum vacuolatum TaxID=63740 RepID=A0A238W9U9_HALVU|nr:hypothetical protein [Halorubrum vacuolatum]SNR43064.1 hypothetical protein SAMN06264855_10659 [Halorubrum vacuolatum]